ncbi:hypothetical protein ACVCAH_13285 [Micromonospora sp. LZ34]
MIDMVGYSDSHLDDPVNRCPQLTALARRVREFAVLHTGRLGHDLDAWMTAVETERLFALHALARKDLPAVVAGLTLPYSNGPIVGARTWSSS